MAIKDYDYSENKLKAETLNDKKKNYKTKVTTYLTSTVKDDFLNDCINKEMIESRVSRNILEIYYKIIIPQIPNNKYMEFVEIKKYLSEKIKFQSS